MIAALLCAFLVTAGEAFALEPAPSDWTSLAEVPEIQVLSENPDGSARETTVWLAVVEGQGFIRTGDTSWYPNLQRKPEIGVRVEGAEYAVRAELIEEPELREKVVAEFRRKYGWSDVFVDWVFPGDGHVIRLNARRTSQ